MNVSYSQRRSTCCGKDRYVSKGDDPRGCTHHISTRGRPRCRRHHLQRHFAHALADDMHPSISGESEHNVALRGARLWQRLTRLPRGAAAHAAPSLATRSDDCGVWWKWISRGREDHRRAGSDRVSWLHFRPFMGSRNEGPGFLLLTPRGARQRSTNVVGRSIESTPAGNAGPVIMLVAVPGE
jgi:hypothetical protein